MKVVFTILAIAIVFSSYSQDCGCDHFINLDAEYFSGEDVLPGETVCLEAGMRGYLKIKGLNGTEEAPILIKNCDGQVAFSADIDFGLAILSCNYIQLSGTGSDAYEFGFLFQDLPGDGIMIAGLSSNIEMDHLKLINIGSVAVKLTENPKCDLSANEGYFTFENCNIHEVFIDDCQTGIQIGHPLFRLGFLNPFCGLLYPYSLEGVVIVNNQISSANRDAVALYGVTGELRNNVIVSTGWSGIHAGAACHLEVSQNTISQTAKSGFELENGGFVNLWNNLFWDNGTGGYPGVSISFYVPLGLAFENEVHVKHNTIVKSGGKNLAVENAFLASSESTIVNNIFCAPTPEISEVFELDSYVSLIESPLVGVSNNSNAETVFEAHFFNPDEADFRLTHASPALNLGEETAIPFDFIGEHRNLGGQPDAGAFEYQPEPLAYFEEIALVGLYVDDFKNILGDFSAETQLLDYAQDNGFNYLLLYNLAFIHANYYDLTNPDEAIVLANFIERAKKDYGIVQMGAVGEKDASFNKIEAFNALYGDNWFQKFDVLNLEFEFWTDPGSAVFTYYCETYLEPGGYPCTNEGAYAFYTDQLELIDERAHSMGIISEIYVGYMSDEESIGLAERTDRILLHHYRTSDTYGDGSSIYNYHTYRIRAIALSERKPAIMPIFSSRSYHMGPWLLSNSLHQPMDTWLNGIEGYYEDDYEGVSDLPVAGFQWYRYTSFLDLLAPSRAVTTDVNSDAVFGNSAVAVSQNVGTETITVTFNELLDNSNYNLTIYDINGRVIWSAPIFSQQSSHDITSLPSGVYVSVISSDTEIVNTTKVIR